MNKLFKGMSLILVISLLLLGFGSASVSAQAGLTTLTSSMQIYNQSSSTAHITIDFYNSSGVVLLSMSDTINATSSKTYFVSTTSLPAGFSGSAVISSDQPLSAISNINTSDYAFASSTTSFAGGNTSFNLPLIMCNNSGFNTFFNVQNVGTADAHITVNYNKGSHGANSSEIATIASGAAKTFDQKTGSSTVNCSTLAGTDGKFIGSVVISSDQPVVATAMETNVTTFRILLGYNGFPAGSAKVGLPLIMAMNSSFYTGVQVMNVGGASCASITMTYSPNTASGMSWVPTAETFSLAAGASKTIIQGGTTPGNGSVNNFNTAAQKYIGSATVAGTACSLVAIVNQTSVGSASMGPFGSSYEGFDPSSATANLVAPLIMAQNSGYYTGIQIQNVDTAACASITMTYGPNVASGKTWVPTAEVFSIAAGSSKTFIQAGTTPSNGSVVGNNFNDPVAHKYVGSASIVGAGCKLIAIVNEQNITLGDKLYTYDGFNY